MGSEKSALLYLKCELFFFLFFTFKQQKFISAGSRGWEFQDQDTRSRLSSFSDSHLLSVSPCGRQGEGMFCHLLPKCASPTFCTLFLIEGSLLYSIVLVFAKHESVIGIHVSPPSWISLPHLPPHPTPLGCSRASVWLSWVIQQILVNFYSMSCSQTNCLSMGCSWESRYTENDLMKENCFWKWIFKSLNWIVLIIRSWGRLCYPVGKCLRFNEEHNLINKMVLTQKFSWLI